MLGRVALVALVMLAAAGPASAAPGDLTDDGNGKRWRQLTETVGMTPAQVAT
jgi:hypothetical protein